MTLNQFFTALQQVPGRWISKDKFRVKIDGCEYCPITAVLYVLQKHSLSNCDWRDACKLLKLRSSIGMKIVLAADNNVIHDRKLRLKLNRIING